MWEENTLANYLAVLVFVVNFHKLSSEGRRIINLDKMGAPLLRRRATK